MSINKVILLGFVGQQPTIKTFDNGDKIASFSLATTERAFKTKDGQEIPEKTEWHNIIANKGLAKIVESYVQKGSKIYIEGKIKQRSWEKDGSKHYLTEIIAENIELLDKKSEMSA